jgi:hypothetical protein
MTIAREVAHGWRAVLLQAWKVDERWGFDLTTGATMIGEPT